MKTCCAVVAAVLAFATQANGDADYQFSGRYSGNGCIAGQLVYVTWSKVGEADMCETTSCKGDEKSWCASNATRSIQTEFGTTPFYATVVYDDPDCSVDEMSSGNGWAATGNCVRGVNEGVSFRALVAPNSSISLSTFEDDICGELDKGDGVKRVDAAALGACHAGTRAFLTGNTSKIANATNTTKVTIKSADSPSNSANTAASSVLLALAATLAALLVQ